MTLKFQVFYQKQFETVHRSLRTSDIIRPKTWSGNRIRNRIRNSGNLELGGDFELENLLDRCLLFNCQHFSFLPLPCAPSVVPFVWQPELKKSKEEALHRRKYQAIESEKVVWENEGKANSIETTVDYSERNWGAMSCVSQTVRHIYTPFRTVWTSLKVSFSLTL